jgi:hypothetical protein
MLGPQRMASSRKLCNQLSGGVHEPAAADPHFACTRRSSHTAAPTSALTWCGHNPRAPDLSAGHPSHPAHTGRSSNARSAATPRTGPPPQSPTQPPGPRAQCGTAARQPTPPPAPIPAPPRTPTNDEKQETEQRTFKPCGGAAMSSIYRDRTTQLPTCL